MLNLFIHTYITIFFLLTPFFVISTFLSLTTGMDIGQRRRIAIRTAMAVIVSTMCIYLFGNHIFSVFGITLDAFRIGAGALLFLSATSLISGRSEQSPPSEGEDIAVVPLAMPVAVGPGMIGMLLVLGSDISQKYGDNTWMQATAILALLLAAISVGILLYISASAERFISNRIMSVLTKLTGLIVASIAAQLIFTGIKNFLCDTVAP